MDQAPELGRRFTGISLVKATDLISINYFSSSKSIWQILMRRLDRIIDDL